MFLGAPKTDAYGPGDNSFNDDALYVDGLVQKLDVESVRILHEYYVVSGRAQEIALRVGMHPSRLFRR
jgi:hypothetical protein